MCFFVFLVMCTKNCTSLRQLGQMLGDELEHFIVALEASEVQLLQVAEGAHVVEKEPDEGRLRVHDADAGEAAQTSGGALRHLLPQSLERQIVATHPQVASR